MKVLIQSDELAKDVASAESLLERHQEHKVPYYMKFSRHLNFVILPKFCILNHFNFALLSMTQFTFSWQYYLTCP